MYKTDSKRMPGNEYSKRELLGKYVRIASNASGRNYNKFGRIIGFSKKGDYVTVYISDTNTRANFCRSSLELIN